VIGGYPHERGSASLRLDCHYAVDPGGCGEERRICRLGDNGDLLGAGTLQVVGQGAEEYAVAQGTESYQKEFHHVSVVTDPAGVAVVRSGR